MLASQEGLYSVRYAYNFYDDDDDDDDDDDNNNNNF